MSNVKQRASSINKALQAPKNMEEGGGGGGGVKGEGSYHSK